MQNHLRSFLSWLILLALLAGSFAWAATVQPATAAHTPDPSSVTIAGSLQSELGCPGDWQPECTATQMTYDPDDTVWQGTFALPASSGGAWEYKAALNGDWAENYGRYAAPNGANIPLNLPSAQTVKFYYSHETHWVTDNVNSVIVTAPGSFQSELGCPGDWQPDCLRSWLQDPEEDGTYTFSTLSIPPGNYEVKAAIGESWDENYGAGGVQNGPNIPFEVTQAGSTVLFSYEAASHVLTVSVTGQGGSSNDNNVEYFGLGHDSRDPLYRVPFGAVTPSTELTLRFRTYHNDVTGVRVRFWDSVARQQFFQNMERVASDVSCYDPDQPTQTCDFWQTTYTPSGPNTLWYRFIVTDGTATAFYDDDRFGDGGWGEAIPTSVDRSYAVTVYDPAFEPIDWLQDGVVYQIFPDRFRNGRTSNDPSPREPRYGYPPEPLDQIINKSWDELPEGYCRNYQDAAEPCSEGPRGRDYFGGDLRGVIQRLNYLQDLGVTVIYFNPIFESGSNHGYDTQDYYRIDHFFGTQQDWEALVREANRRGIRIVLDGVFNHVSSDSPYFDRYGRYTTVGACESVDSPYRSWFYFNDVTPGTGVCVGSDGSSNSANYDSWFGFDSIPVLNKNNPEVKDLIYAGENAVASYWLDRGAAGWRLDVMGDLSFPSGFWPEFRDAVKSTKADAPVIGELWKKAEVLDMVRGDAADTAMNYRFRNAILGFFGKVDDKGFPDDQETDQPPSLFARKLDSVREDYPDAAYYTMLNILDSHDTERILWSLTPGPENREAKEFDAANLMRGKRLLELATIVQMTVPGAPTIYYGDEVGVTGDDDPDDRRTFPWINSEQNFGAGGDLDLLAHYKQMTALREANPVFREGELIFLLTNDADRTLAYLLRTGDQAAIVAINRSDEAKTLDIELDGRLPAAVQLADALNGVGTVNAIDSTLTIELPGLSAAVLLPAPGQDLTPPPAPTGLDAQSGDQEVTLSWNSVSGAAAYEVYRSPVTGGGYVLAGQTSETTFVDTEVEPARTYYYVVRALDTAGNRGAASNEDSATPSYVIGWANLQWPPTLTYTVRPDTRTDTVYGQVWIDGVTNQPGPTEGLRAQLGFGPDDSHPDGNADWSWVEASFNVDAGSNDEYQASLQPTTAGTFDYAYRYSGDGGLTWIYADLDGSGNGYSPDQAGSLTVTVDDTTPPAAPSNLRVNSASLDGVQLEWDPVLGDDSLYGYEVSRGLASGGPYTVIATVTTAGYTDLDVVAETGYYYRVRSVDNSLNYSPYTSEVHAFTALRTVEITFTVTVPAHTPATATVYIAGSLHLLDGGLPEWDPGGVAMTNLGNNQWQVTFTGKETTQLEYKYTLGTWEQVEKDAVCGELTNRRVTLTYGTTGVQAVNDTVENWRNVSPCGN